MTDCDSSFDLEITKRVEVDDETLSYAEEGDTEIDKGAEPEFPFTRRQREGTKRNQIRMVKTLS